MKKRIYNILIALFGAVFVISGAALASYLIQGAIQESRYDRLSSLRQDQSPRPAVGEDTQTATEPTVALVEITDPVSGRTVSMLPEFESLYRQNSHLVGWLTVPGTKIDYPVMQTPEEPDYYLHRNFDRQDSKRGCLYVWPQSDVSTPSDNVTVFGHHMGDGSMFGQLDKYRDPQFRRENPYIYFDCLQQKRTYEVMAVFITTATTGKGFAYHNFTDAASETDFDAFVQECQSLSLYDTGITAGYGDKLVCLSTCEYSRTNGRLVVVAKQVG
jgi:sortase B